MSTRRSGLAAACFGSLVSASLLLACTLSRPLDYLTSGDPDGGAVSPGDGESSSDRGVETDGPGTATGEVLARDQFDPANLVQDADNLYWSTFDNAITKLPKAGGTAVRLATAPGAGSVITGLAAERAPAGSVYAIVSGGVQRVPKAGGPLVEVVKSNTPAIQIQVDENALYAVHGTNDEEASYVARYGKDGSNPTALSDPEDVPTTIALNETSLFWAGYDADAIGVVTEVSKSAGADAGGLGIVHRNTGSDELFPLELAFAVDETSLYWVDDTNDAERLYGLPLKPASGLASRVYSPQAGAVISHLAVDERFIYFFERSATGPVLRVSKSGGAVPEVIGTQPNPTALVVDQGVVYVASRGVDIGAHGVIARIAK